MASLLKLPSSLIDRPRPGAETAGRRAVALLLALWGALACASSPEPPPASGEPGPLLWRARPAEGPGALYLLGSVHVGKREPELGPTVEAVWAEADELVVEVDLAALDPAAMAPLVLRYGTIAPPDDLRSRLSDETWELLEPQLARLGLPLEALLRFEPWVVASLLAVSELERAGYEEELGVDRALLQRAQSQRAQSRLPVRPLETAESQVRMFADLPAELQELMLLETLVREGEPSQEIQELLGAWESADEDALAAVLFRPLAEYPELAPFYDAVFFQRNEAMTARLIELSRDGRTRLVVLGAGHMVGERGIPALLARRGFRVERVRP